MRLNLGLATAAALAVSLVGATSAVTVTEAKVTGAFFAKRGEVPSIRQLRTYRYDEERVNFSASMLEKLKGLFTPPTATTEIVQGWLKTSKLPSDTFVWLRLDKAGDKLFENGQFTTWVKYVDSFNKQHPENPTTAIATLASHFSSQELTKILEAAKKVPGTTKLATRLEGELRWIDKDTPAQYFTRLALDKQGSKLLESPELTTWLNYMKLFNKDNPHRQTSLVATLTKSYGDDGLVKIIEAARKVPSTATTAKRLEAEQVQLWLKNEKTPNSVFQLLKLHLADDQLLTSPQLTTWLKYMKLFNSDHPDKQTTLITTLSANYGPKELAGMLMSAQKVSSTKDVATTLQAEQVKLWADKRILPDETFIYLGLDKTGDALLANPQFTTWIDYADSFLARGLNLKLAVIKTLEGHYTAVGLANLVEAGLKVAKTEAVAKRVEAEMFRGWISHPYSADDVFKVLELDAAGNKVLESPLLNTWTKYMVKFNKQEPEEETTLIATLTEFYDKEKLTNILEEARKTPSTEKLATDLQRALANQ